MNRREAIKYIKTNIAKADITPPEIKPIIATYLIQRAIGFKLDDKIIESDVKSVTTYLKEVKFINSSEDPNAGETTLAYASGISNEIREAQIVFYVDRVKDESPKELYRNFAHEMDHILHYLAEKIDENDKPNSNNFHSYDIKEGEWDRSFHENIVERIASMLVEDTTKYNPFYSTNFSGYGYSGWCLEMFLAGFGLGEYECLKNSLKSKNVLKRYISDNKPFDYNEVDDTSNAFEHCYNYLHKAMYREKISDEYTENMRILDLRYRFIRYDEYL